MWAKLDYQHLNRVGAGIEKDSIELKFFDARKEANISWNR